MNKEQSNISKEHCPKCGAKEVEANTPKTIYECGSSEYDQRPGTLIRSDECKRRVKYINKLKGKS